MAEKYLGYSIKDKNNKIQLTYDRDAYIAIIENAVALNITPARYLDTLCRPCQSCGSDKVFFDKLQVEVKKKHRAGAQTQIFIFENSTINSQVQKTNLKLNYVFACTLQLSTECDVYTPILAHKYDNKDCNAVIVVFKENVKTCTYSCIIKGNQIFNQ